MPVSQMAQQVSAPVAELHGVPAAGRVQAGLVRQGAAQSVQSGLEGGFGRADRSVDDSSGEVEPSGVSIHVVQRLLPVVKAASSPR